MSHLIANQRAFGLVLFCVGIGFCQPMHVFPLPNFIEEFLVGLGVLVAAGVMFWRLDQLKVSIWMLMWGVLGGLLALSSYLHFSPFISYKVGFALYWFIGLLALMIGEQLDWCVDGARLSRWLAIALLTTALLCAIGGFFRFYGLLGAGWRSYVPEPNTGRMTGLVGHSNFFAFISFFGLLSAGWLLGSRQCSKVLCGISLIVLTSAIIATGNRGVLVAWVVVIGMLFFSRDTQNTKIWLYFMLGAFLFYWLFRPVYYAFDTWFYAIVEAKKWVAGAGTSESDVLTRGAVSSERLLEWKISIELIRENFFTGLGVGNYAISSFQQNIDDHVSPAGLFIHSHNSPLQVVLDFGLAGLAWLTALFAIAGRAIWRASKDFNRLLPVLVVLTIQTYGMFEFPMWMMHFLVLNMVLLGALSDHWRVVGVRIGKIFTVFLLLSGAFASLIYVPLVERFIWSYRQTFIRADVSKSEYAFVDSVISDPVLEPYGYLLYFNNFNLAPETLDKERVAVKRMNGFLPFPQVLVREALINKIDGDETAALKVLSRMRAFYGLSYENVLLQQINATKKKFPNISFESLVVPTKSLGN